MILVGVAIAFIAFTLSACAGLGGSLILVPTMALVFGTKQGIAIAALLLACNNVGKVIAYRKTIPLKAAAMVIALTVVGAAIGANAMLAVPTLWLDVAIVAVIVTAFLTEAAKLKVVRRVSSPALAFLSGCTSGFSGTSGPLKGLAIRNLDLPRLYFVGAASMVSFAGDVVKASIYTKASLLTEDMWIMVICCLLVVPFAVLLGRNINTRLGEQMFAGVFWVVMIGYAGRLVIP